MEKAKPWIISAGAALSSWLGVLAVPMAILIICNIIDYATGIAATKCRYESVRSDKGFRGIAKKICMWLLVAVGGLIDWLLAHTMDITNFFELPFHFMIASVVAVWLIANEIISILENIGDIGAPLPPFLMKIARGIKSQAEEQVKINNRKDEEND